VADGDGVLPTEWDGMTAPKLRIEVRCRQEMAEMLRVRLSEVVGDPNTSSTGIGPCRCALQATWGKRGLMLARHD
jgi:hypothetical protein